MNKKNNHKTWPNGWGKKHVLKKGREMKLDKF